MLTVKSGNLFDEPADLLVNAVNCDGIMGKGIALEFKKRCPEMFLSYLEMCKKKELRPGGYHAWPPPRVGLSVGVRHPWIFNLVTKDHWRDPSEYVYIRSGLYALVSYVKSFQAETEQTQLPKVLLPALGCGNGGLQWHKVLKIMERMLGDLPNEFVVFEPRI